jgi:hypothetical protein
MAPIVVPLKSLSRRDINGPSKASRRYSKISP